MEQTRGHIIVVHLKQGRIIIIELFPCAHGERDLSIIQYLEAITSKEEEVPLFVIF